MYLIPFLKPNEVCISKTSKRVHPSIICTLFIFYHFIRSPNLRKKSRNHILICLLLVNFIQEIIELPPRLYFLYMNTVPFLNPVFCQFWNLCQYTLVSISQFIMALGSIDHYLFIFHRVFLTEHTLLLLHLPLFLCIFLPIIFYAVSIYIPSCITIFLHDRIGCGIPCFFSAIQFAHILKNIIINSFPVITIIIFNILIVIRVFIQRNKMKRLRRRWQENVLLISQLLPLAILYLIIWIPMCILFCIITVGTPLQQSSANLLINNYFGNLTYIINFFCPFLICVGEHEQHRAVVMPISPNNI
ncbi:unnamed protein product [Adineta steineri]|uniref:G-protein coupled receptors family 1 profile domain-containing protein n=1 Tax=Adineta steineri TaxID=433720 RepID=A0A819BF27_9BILA|nr:unnamed protein product [Adineta steineri]CAF4051957.1 unnamed protein product [Adineta steineri]